MDIIETVMMDVLPSAPTIEIVFYRSSFPHDAGVVAVSKSGKKHVIFDGNSYPHVQLSPSTRPALGRNEGRE